MRSWRHKALIPVIASSVVAEAACWFAAWFASPERSLFQLFVAFHRPALAVAGFLVPELYEDDPNISGLEGVIVWIMVIAGALLQWFLIFLGVALVRQRFFGKRHQQALGV